ncbi:MAG: short chain dehydrogenase [Bacteroidetes bacterium HGW-Bacteroidetes-15]|nr:MAG: short chain dehydrogenase [Bacteroidetes bacterium HGW-Bacteroidetes-15]
MKSKPFINKIAIVTGASSGIGKAMTIELSLKGATVVLAARNVQFLAEVESTINKSGGKSLVVKTDITDEAQCKALIDKTIQSFGKIDILVNNAGVSMRSSFLDVEISVLKRLMDTNFWGAVYATKYALPYILESKGSIVGISSVSGVTPLPGRSGYVASKHALDGFLETLRVENLDNNIQVLLVHPGFTSSNIRNAALNSNGQAYAETPLDESKLMSAETVARIVVKGIIKRKREINLTFTGRLAMWAFRHFPSITERLIYRAMKKEAGAPF